MSLTFSISGQFLGQFKGIHETRLSSHRHQLGRHAGFGYCGQLAGREPIFDFQRAQPRRFAGLCHADGLWRCFHFFAHQQAHGQVDHWRASHRPTAKRRRSLVGRHCENIVTTR